MKREKMIEIQNDILVRLGFDFHISTILTFVESILTVMYPISEDQNQMKHLK